MVFVPVAALAVVLAALVFLIFYEATEAIGTAMTPGIAGWFEHAPFPLNLMSDIIKTSVSLWTNAIQSFLSSQIDARTRPIRDAMNTQANANRFNAYSLRNVHAQTIDQLNRVTVAQRGEVTGAVAEFTNNAVADSEQRTDSEVRNSYDAATQYTVDSYVQLADWSGNAISSIESDLHEPAGVVSRTAGELQQSIDGVRDTAFAAITASAQETLVTGEQYTDERVAETNNVIEGVNSNLIGYVQATRDNVLGEMQQRIDPLEQTTIGIQAYLATTVLTAITDTANWRNECGDPMCGGLLGLAKGFSGLRELLGLGLMTGFLIAAIADPEDTATASVAVADALTGIPRELAAELFGVR